MRRARTTDGLVTRLGRRITKDGDGLLALLVGFGAFVLAVLDVLGNDVVGPDVLSAAILFVLALLAPPSCPTGAARRTWWRRAPPFDRSTASTPTSSATTRA
jgi:hypothetical protein